MSAKIISGKDISASVMEQLKAEVSQLTADGIRPGLAVIIVGNNPASRVYVNNKKAACEKLGIYSEEHALPEDTDQETLLALIRRLNADSNIHGILCQFPLPKHLDEKIVTANILPEKDVDAFHAENVGKIVAGRFSFLPCTPAGVVEMLKHENISVSGKKCVVVGRSDIVGKPMAMLLLHQNGTVTICHSRTRDLKAETLQADILVAAVGKEKVITADMVKPGAVVIDVGMNRNSEGKLCGDVDFAPVSEVASYITPVPGGVGPMTITMLMKNTITAAKNSVR